MNVKNQKLLTICLLTAYGLLQPVFGVSPSKGTPKPANSKAIWVHEESDLAPDPSVVWGNLENGIRYVIMPNDEPPGQVSLRLYVDAGSLMETEDQRGLAHFLEHMAFKGGKYFPDQTSLKQYFEHIGMGFGADTNAHTGLDETVYKLDLPKNTEEYLRDGIKLFSDFAGGLLFNSSDIESERGVILSEKRDHYTVEERTRDVFFEFAFPGTILPLRMPIGIEEVIQNAPRERFLKFYQDWYNTNRVVVVVVGDVKPAQIVPLIKEYFGPMKPPTILKGDPDLGKLASSTEVKAKVYIENEATAADLEFFVVRPHKKHIDSQEQRIKDIQKSIAYGILGKRLELISKSESAPFSSSSANDMDLLFQAFDISYIDVAPKEGMWEQSVPIIEQELRRVLKYGFTPAEISEAKANVINSYEQAVQSAPKRKSKTLSTSIVSELSDKKVFTSPEEDLRIAKLALDNLTAEKSLELFKEDWVGYSPLIFLTGDSGLNATEAKLLEVYKKSLEVPVEAPKNELVPEFAYKSFGTPGKIVEEGYYDKTDVYHYRFSNNVRLNLKKTNFDSDMIYISVKFGSGELEEPSDKRGLGSLASAVFYQGGLEKHSTRDLERIFSGKTMSVSFSVGSNAFDMIGLTNKRDFADEMALMAAFMTAPGYRDEAFRRARVDFEEAYRGLELTPDSVLANRADRFLASGNERFGVPDKEKFFALTKEDVKNWLSGPLASGYLEISVVGDFNKDEVIAAVAKTFGALPTRAMMREQQFQDDSAQFPTGGIKKTFDLNSEFEKAVSVVYWPTTDYWNVETNRRLTVLSRVFADRLLNELRIKLGETYSPSASNVAYTTDKGYGRFYALANVRSEQAGQVIDIILQLGKDLATKGVTQDEFERAIKPLLRSLDLTERSNTYWLGVLGESQVHPELIKWAENRKADFESFTVEDINKVAKEYLQPDKAVAVMIIANKEKKQEERK